MNGDDVQPPPLREADLIEEGCYVVIEQQNEKNSIVLVKRNGTARVGKSTVSLDPLVGAPYGSEYAVEGGCLVPADPVLVVMSDLQADDRNNKQLVDDGTAQALTQDEIQQMKRDGKSGEEIVKAIAAASATLSTKTAFSQEKYLKKKMKKYCLRAIAHRPTALRICEAYFANSPARIAYLRVDALAMLLSMANASAGQRVLVLDSSSGLVTGAVVERLGGLGEVCVVSEERQQQVDIVRTFNFPEAQLATLFGCTFADLAAVFAGEALPEPQRPGGRDGGERQGQGQAHGHGQAAAGEAGPSGAAAEGEAEAEAEGAPGGGKGGKRRAGGHGGQDGVKCSSGRVQRASPDRLAAWAASGGFTSLVVAAPTYDTSPALRRLLPFLSPGCPFVAFHNSLQPLADALADLRDARMAAAMDVHEPWMRDYQVLPNRTHPHMQMSATGGYLLCGHRLAPQATEEGGKKGAQAAAGRRQGDGAAAGGGAAAGAGDSGRPAKKARAEEGDAAAAAVAASGEGAGGP